MCREVEAITCVHDTTLVVVTVVWHEDLPPLAGIGDDVEVAVLVLFRR